MSFTKRIQDGSYTTKEGESKPLHHKIRFIDSFKFMGTSLDNLVNTRILPKNAFYNVKRYYTGDKLMSGSFGLYQEENATDRRDWNRKANRTNFRN